VTPALNTASIGSVLLAEDDDDLRTLMVRRLRERGFEVTPAADGNQAVAALVARSYDIVVTDLRIPGIDGLAVLRQARLLAPQTLVVVASGYATADGVIQALREGAADFLQKPLSLNELAHTLERLLARRNLLRETPEVPRQIDTASNAPTSLVGESAPILRIKTLIAQVAKTDSTVLITGESGVGKEVVARAIHAASHLHERVFLPVNCAAIPDQLLESELFGHNKGSFTGADAAREGLFRKARGGTLLLDEIGEMPPHFQSKLLRAIEMKEILPIGSGSPVSVRVRIIASTNRDLRKAVEEGRFREDLFYRLNVIRVDVPPLRERREDIPQLVGFLMDRHNRTLRRAYKGVDSAAMSCLLDSPWKGNVRELDHSLEYAMTVGNGEWVRVADLPPNLVPTPLGAIEGGEGLEETVRHVERTHIERALRLCGSDRRSAARKLGIDRSTLYRKIKELGIKLALGCCMLNDGAVGTVIDLWR
jgi:two-component system response regulator HydG